MATLERPHWLTVKEVAHLLDLHEVSVRRKIARVEIPGVFQLGGPGCAVRILQEELERWLQARTERCEPSNLRPQARESQTHPGPDK
jgi:excisionase family DNA binding protein